MKNDKLRHGSARSRAIILLGLGSILLLVTLLITIGIWTLSASKSRLDKVVNLNIRKIQLVNNMRSAARERTISLQHILVVDDESEYEAAVTRMSHFGGEFVIARNTLLALLLSEKEKVLLDKQAQLSRHIGPIQNHIAELIDFGEQDNARNLLITEAIPLQDKVFEVMTQLQDIQRNEMNQAIKESSDNYTTIVRSMWVVTSIVILLGVSIVFFILRMIRRNDRKEVNYRQSIEHQAFYDHLTGLPNRRLLKDRMEHASAQTLRNECLMAVLFIDCDRFKPINDSLGHAVGDGLLVSIADRLKKHVRDSDTVCRFSGDEFCVLLEGIEHMSLIDRIAQSLIDAIALPHYIEGHKVFTTISVGITVFPLDHKEGSGLLTSADIAMYHAKQNGGGQYEYYDSEMNTQSKERLALELDLHDALANEELELYYQPLNAISGEREVIGAEALLRWNHPERGLVPPNDFIEIAESTGLIVPIGEWVLMTACKQAAVWEKKGYGQITISVNLSPRQFVDTKLVTAVEQAITKSGIQASQLDLEITESTAMDKIEKTIDILHKLKELGVHVSIDDFGTGYSSLSHLQQMPIDNLKIDRSFVKNLHKSSKDKAFIQAIVTMARTLGMKTIAEGVELNEQFVFLQDVECEIAQGFLFSKPVPAKDFMTILRGHMDSTGTQ